MSPGQAFGRNQKLIEHWPVGVVSLEPQPFLQCHQSALKTQWVMVVALWYRPSGWLVGLRLLRGRFEGKGAVGGMSPFPVAGSPETTPRPGLRWSLVVAECLHWERSMKETVFLAQGAGEVPDHFKGYFNSLFAIRLEKSIWRNFL